MAIYSPRGIRLNDIEIEAHKNIGADMQDKQAVLSKRTDRREVRVRKGTVNTYYIDP